MSTNGQNSSVLSEIDGTISEIRGELENLNPNLKKKALEKFALAALGSIPWVGSFISAAVNLKTRETTYDGRFLKKRPSSKAGSTSLSTMESAFEDSKPYVLTELRKQFVHYTMNEVVSRLGGDNA